MNLPFDIRLRRFFARWHRVNLLVLWAMAAGLIVAKACGAIATPWVVVLAPVWGGPALYLLVIVGAVALTLVLLLLATLLRMLP